MMSSWEVQQVLLHLLLLLCCCTRLTQQQASGGATVLVTEHTANPVVLQHMINTSVNSIGFEIPSFTFLPAAWDYISASTPIVVDRDFAIFSRNIEPPTTINYQLLDAKVALGPGTTFLLDGVVLEDARMLGSYTVDWFVNSPGATVRLENVVLVDDVCNATDAADDLARAAALPQLPGRPRNLVTAAPRTCVRLAAPPAAQQQQQQQQQQGEERCFGGGVLMHSLTVVVQPGGRRDRAVLTSAREAAAAAAAPTAFVFAFRNTTRLCQSYLDAACLQQQAGNASACWERAAGGLARSMGGSTAQLSAGALAGIIIGGIAAAALLLAGVALIMRSKRRHSGSRPFGGGDGSRKQQQQRSQHADAQEGSSHGAVQAGGMTVIADVANKGSFGQDGLQLGVLLDAGSYGRVFRGRWHGRDVAIKIINCYPEELPKVLREAEIMMQVDHPNVVKALNCVVRHNPAASAAPSISSPSSSTPQTGQQGSASSSHLGRHTRSSGSSGTRDILRVLGKGQQEHPQQQEQQQQHDMSVRDQATSSHPHGSPTPSRAAATAAAAGGLGSGSSAAAAAGAQQQGQQAVLPVMVLQPQQRSEASLSPQTSAGAGAGTAKDAENSNEQVAEVWLVLELCTGGNLQDSVVRRRDGFDLGRLLCRLTEVANGMAYLHSQGIMHGDLKAANCLLVNSVHGSYGQIAKITDLGLSGVLNRGATHHTTANLGTISHCAPELLERGAISPSADVYAMGIMMWELYTSSSAWKNDHYGSIVHQVVGGGRPPLPPDMPDEYALLMQACWAAAPNDRPSFEQVKECLLLMLRNLDSATASGCVVSELPPQLATPAAAGDQPHDCYVRSSAAAAAHAAAQPSSTSSSMASTLASSHLMHQPVSGPDRAAAGSTSAAGSRGAGERAAAAGSSAAATTRAAAGSSGASRTASLDTQGSHRHEAGGGAGSRPVSSGRTSFSAVTPSRHIQDL